MNTLRSRMPAAMADRVEILSSALSTSDFHGLLAAMAVTPQSESGTLQWHSVVLVWLEGMGFKSRHAQAVVQHLMTDDPGRWRQAPQ